MNRNLLTLMIAAAFALAGCGGGSSAPTAASSGSGLGGSGTASSGSGGGGSSATQYADVLYAPYNPSGPVPGTLAAYAIDAGTGALTAVGSGAPTGNSPLQAVKTPNGQFVYTANYGDGTISAYAVNASSGALTALPGSPFSFSSLPALSGQSLLGMVIDASGKYLYAIFGNVAAGGTIVACSIATSGAIATINQGVFPQSSPINGGSYAVAATSGGYLYLANNTASGGQISAFQINPSSGLLTPISTTPIPSTLEVSGSMTAVGNALYLTGEDTATASNAYISEYAIDPSSGQLTHETDWQVGQNTIPVDLVANPAGSALYATLQSTASGGNGEIVGYTVNPASGALTAMPTSPFATGAAPDGLAFAPAGNFAYVANAAGGSVTGYAVDATTGALTSLQGGAPLATGSTPLDVLTEAP